MGQAFTSKTTNASSFPTIILFYVLTAAAVATNPSGSVAASQLVPGPDPRCPPSRPFYNDKFLSCVECRVSSDCPVSGHACYIGECAMHCPSGMFMDYVVRNKQYYIDLDNHLDAAKLWKAYEIKSDAEGSPRQEIFDQIKAFDTDTLLGASYLDGEGLPTVGGELMPMCECNRHHGFKWANNSYSHGTVIGHPFSKVCACDDPSGFCESEITISVLGYEMGSKSLTPAGKPANCWGVTYNDRWAFVALSAVAIFIAIFAYRSSSSMLYDFHRLNMWNIIGTWTFAIMFLIDDPHLAGYTRFLGVGIFAHNAAEWNYMIRLWFGNGLNTRQIISWWGMTFLAVMMILIMVLPMQTQLVLAGTLGAMLDFTFLLMSYPMLTLSRENKRGICLRGESCTSSLIFLIAYLAHLIALGVIFGAMSSGNVSLQAWILFILATFVQFFLLELFAYNQNHRAVCCGPYASSSYMMAPTSDPYVFKLIENPEATSTSTEPMLVHMATNGGVRVHTDGLREMKSGNTDMESQQEGVVMVRDLSIFPDGLNERARGCKECGCCLSKAIQKKLRVVTPFFVYLPIGFILALIVNVNLFVTAPMTKGREDFDHLDAGDCPTYYPIRANRGIPAWLTEQDGDTKFMQTYGWQFTANERGQMATTGVIIVLILIGLLFTLVGLQSDKGLCCQIRCCDAFLCDDDFEEKRRRSLAVELGRTDKPAVNEETDNESDFVEQ